MKNYLYQYFQKKETPKPKPAISEPQPLLDLTSSGLPLKSEPTKQQQSQPSIKLQPQPLPQSIANQINAIRNTKRDSSQITTGEIVIVNNEPIITKKEGFYYKKYHDRISKLLISPPFTITRDSMKVGFDKDLFDYLFNDLTMIYKQKSAIIDNNQKELIDEIEASKELISAYALLQKNSNISFDNYKKELNVINDIDSLEQLINSINQEADDLLKEVEVLEVKVKVNKELENPKSLS